MKHSIGVLVLAMSCAAPALAQIPSASVAPTLGGPLTLADEGMFFVNAKPAVSRFPGVVGAGRVDPGTISVNKMYVHYRIPASRKGSVSVVLVHGGGLTGASFETTPDGREGWATYFARKGYSTYVVDIPGRGRAGFDSTAINQAKIEGNAAVLPASVPMGTAELVWPLFRFGPAPGKPFPNTQFPVEAIAQLNAQLVPLAESTLEGGMIGTAPPALAALLDEIGPAVIVTHSLGGLIADALVASRPVHVKGVVNIEANQVVPPDAQIEGYRGIPVLELFGDHLDAPVFTAKPRYEARKAIVDRINKRDGGKAAIVALPDIGITGNSHMLMQDKNNLRVADYLIDWIGKNVQQAP